MDPDQTAPLGAVWSGSTLFAYEASNILVDGKNIRFVIMRFKVIKCEFSVYTVRIFMKCTHISAAQKLIYSFTKLWIKPDFPSLGDEIAEPRPDINIKVAAFTVSEKSINMINQWPRDYHGVYRVDKYLFCSIRLHWFLT